MVREAMLVNMQATIQNCGFPAEETNDFKYHCDKDGGIDRYEKEFPFGICITVMIRPLDNQPAYENENPEYNFRAKVLKAGFCIGNADFP